MWRYTSTEELYHFGVKGMKWGVRRAQKKVARKEAKIQRTANKVSNFARVAEKYKNDSRKKQAIQTIISGVNNRDLSAKNYYNVKNEAIRKYKDVKTSKYTKNGYDYFETKIKTNGKIYRSTVSLGQHKNDLNSETWRGKSLRESQRHFESKAKSGKSFMKAYYMSSADKAKRLSDAYDVK